MDIRYQNSECKKISGGCISLTTVTRTGIKGNFFSDSSEAGSETEFLTSSGTFFQS